jgi:hypothetical protein
MSEVRIRSNETGRGAKRGFTSRLAAAALAPLFALWLLVPLLRRERRRRGWKWVRICGLMAGAALLAAGWKLRPLLFAGATLLLLSALLGPLADPGQLHALAERLRAKHILNGGFFAGGEACLPVGAAVLLFLTAEELLAAAAESPGRKQWRWPLAEVKNIQIDGQDYHPRDVGFAKAPPARDQNVSRNAACLLALHLAGENEHQLYFEYKGVFARHLAEVAAHTIYRCRALAAKAPVQILRVIR